MLLTLLESLVSSLNVMQAVIEQLEDEKVLLRRAVEVKEHTLEQCSTQLNLLTEQKSQLQMDLGMQLQSATATIAQHLPFVDSSEYSNVIIVTRTLAGYADQKVLIAEEKLM
jgi:D-ribose pyranose/furanose isomerase RbsD